MHNDKVHSSGVRTSPDGLKTFFIRNQSMPNKQIDELRYKALKDEIDTAAAEQFEYIKANQTRARRAKEFSLNLSDMTTTFTVADANNDGFLDRVEFGNWMNSIKAQIEDRGFFVDSRFETIDKNFQICSAMNRDRVGITQN